MKKFIATLFLLLISSSLAVAQAVLPERHMTVFLNTDLVGNDLQQLFDTDEPSCQRACIALEACVAYTFNTKSNACFPKSGAYDQLFFEGAKSVAMRPYAPEVIALAETRAQELSFLKPRDLQNARAFAAGLADKHPDAQWSTTAMRDTARDRAVTGDLFSAWRWMGAVTARTDTAEDWASYSGFIDRYKPSQRSDRRRFTNDALMASINAYLRASAAETRAQALQTMANTLQELGRGRDMIPALKLAQSLSSAPEISVALAEARSKYGFRIVTTDVEAETANPKICVEFNEPLSKDEEDFARFLALPDPRFAVQAEGDELCISGVEFGSRYSVTFRAGLPAQSGEGLDRDVIQSFYVRDRVASASFPGRGYVLPLGGEASLPVQTVNAPELDLTLRRVSDRNLLRAMQDGLFAQPLYRYQESQLGGVIGDEIWSGTGLTDGALNQDVTTRLPIGEAIAGQPAGIYVLSAAVKGDTEPYNSVAQQWFVLSDIGLSTAAGNDGLHVFVKSLKTAQPMSETKVQLVSRANRIIAEAMTDASGAAQFPAALTAGKSGAEPAMVLAHSGNEDLAFLSLTDPAFDLSDRGVSGRNAPKALDLFLTTDRGAYRAGDTIFATTLVRNTKAEALEDLPITAVLLRPDGVEYSRQLSAQGNAGGHVFAMPVATSAPRGAWTLEMRSAADGDALTSTTVLVEDFLPERIDFDIEIEATELSADMPTNARLKAAYLFGAPAADLTVEGRISLSANRTLEAYPGFTFGPYTAGFRTVSDALPSTQTDATGTATIPLALPKADALGLPLEATVRLQVAEGSGRPVERSATRPVQSTTPLVGLKPLFDGVVSEGTEATFDIMVLAANRIPMSADARWTLNRVNTRYQWYEQNGNWNWEPIITRTKELSGQVSLAGGKGTVTAPVDWGEYELVVELEGRAYSSASDSFYAGWYNVGSAVSTPDTLELSLDRESYTVGDDVQLRVLPRSAGTAMVQVMSDRLISTKMVDLTAGENLIPMQVSADWGAGAYVTVTHISPMGMADSFLPTRSIGLAYASVDPADKALDVELLSLDLTKPRQPLQVAIKANNVAAGETAFVTLAAVDAGILNLTGFEPPAPKEHYFGKRKLGVELRDIYGRLIDASKGNLGRIRSGGDAGGAAGLEGPPPTDELVTFFQGPVEIGADGMANIAFDVPEFNGTLRLMAVVWSPTGVGAANKDVIIRDPIVLSVSLPNHLSPGDQSQLRLEITHADGPTGAVGLELASTAIELVKSSLPAKLSLGEGEQAVFTVPMSAATEGDHEITITLTSPEGETLTKTLTLPVRRLDPEVSTTRRLSLAGAKSFLLDANLTEAYRGETTRALVSAGPIAKFDVASLLAKLDRYPYGCTEQLTSTAMPLLYFSAVTEGLGLTQRSDVNERVEKAVARILTRQSSSGSFGLWYPGSGDLWLDAYVTDFLSRTRAQGLNVPDLAFKNALGNLTNRVNNYGDFDSEGGDLAYALYVLAREGQTAVSDLRYYADVKERAFNTPMGKAQLGAALAYHGDQLRADAMFTSAVEAISRMAGPQSYTWRADYGTRHRDTAAVIALGQEAGSKAVNLAALAERITGDTGRHSTQEMVWTLLAVDSLLGAAPSLTLNGESLDLPVLQLDHAELLQGQTLTNTNNDATDITLTTFGVPRVAPEAGGYGYSITRQYYTLDGVPVDALDVVAGERLVTHLKVNSFENASARLMINDPLPAGFEIDNPNLLQSGDIGALSWLTPSRTETTEFRAERFLAAVNASARETVELAYIVRAVTPGRYHHAPATVEDMYRPIYRAHTAAGEVTVSPK